jgi:hypothetical protein
MADGTVFRAERGFDFRPGFRGFSLGRDDPRPVSINEVLQGLEDAIIWLGVEVCGYGPGHSVLGRWIAGSCRVLTTCRQTREPGGYEREPPTCQLSKSVRNVVHPIANRR